MSNDYTTEKIKGPRLEGGENEIDITAEATAAQSNGRALSGACSFWPVSAGTGWARFCCRLCGRPVSLSWIVSSTKTPPSCLSFPSSQ